MLAPTTEAREPARGRHDLPGLAARPVPPSGARRRRGLFPHAADEGSVSAARRSLDRRRRRHPEDVQQECQISGEPGPGPDRGYHTVLSVPMLRDGRPIGAIVVCRQAESRPFTEAADLASPDLRRPGRHCDRERALLTELQEKNHALTAGSCSGDRCPGAADGDQRAAQGDRPVDVRSPAGLRDAGRERGQAVRGRACVDLSLLRAATSRRGYPQRLRRAHRIPPARTP